MFIGFPTFCRKWFSCLRIIHSRRTIVHLFWKHLFHKYKKMLQPWAFLHILAATNCSRTISLSVQGNEVGHMKNVKCRFAYYPQFCPLSRVAWKYRGHFHKRLSQSVQHRRNNLFILSVRTVELFYEKFITANISSTADCGTNMATTEHEPTHKSWKISFSYWLWLAADLCIYVCFCFHCMSDISSANSYLGVFIWVCLELNWSVCRNCDQFSNFSVLFFPPLLSVY